MTDQPRPPTPEEFKVRVQLDLLTRLTLLSLAQSWTSGGLTADQCQTSLEEWLQRNQSKIDDMVGGYAREPAITALYAEEAAEVFENVRRDFAKLLEVYRRHGR